MIPTLLLQILIIALFVVTVWALYRLFRYYLRLPKKISPDLFSPSKYVQIEKFKIHYVQEGKGPHLVLIHGIGSSLHFWKPIFHQLTSDFRVTALDLPGFGLSDKWPDTSYGLDDQVRRVFEILDKLKIKKCHLVGHSLGGAITAWMTQTHPDRVLKLALLAPAVYPRLVWIHPRFLLWGSTFLKNSVVTPSLVRLIYTKACVHHLPKNLDSLIAQYYLPFHQNPNAVIAFIKHNELLRDPRLATDLHIKKNSILLLHGLHDKIIKKHALKTFLERHSHTIFVQDQHSGHMLTEENPDFVIENLRNFFDITPN